MLQVLGSNAFIDAGCVVEDSVLMGNTWAHLKRLVSAMPATLSSAAFLPQHKSAVTCLIPTFVTFYAAASTRMTMCATRHGGLASPC